jgi:hypothetical protein
MKERKWKMKEKVLKKYFKKTLKYSLNLLRYKDNNKRKWQKQQKKSV